MVMWTGFRRQEFDRSRVEYLFQTTFNIVMLLKYHNITCTDEAFELPRMTLNPVKMQVGSSGETKALTSSGHFSGSESDTTSNATQGISQSNFYKQRPVYFQFLTFVKRLLPRFYRQASEMFQEFIQMAATLTESELAPFKMKYCIP
jgi:hypothetical protein